MKSTSIKRQIRSAQVKAALSGHWVTAMLVACLSALVMTACGSSGGSSNPGIVVNPDGSIVGGNCPTGQSYTPTSGCVNTYSARRLTGTMNSINRSALGTVLKLRGVCDQYTLVNLGSYDCSTYTSRAFVAITVAGNQAQAVLYVGASSMYNTSGGMYPIPFSSQLNPINNSTGYVLQESTGLQLYIDSGDLTGNNIPAHITYQGGTIGTLTLTSY